MTDKATHIKQPYTLAEIKERIASNDYSAELMLQHAMLIADAQAKEMEAVGAGGVQALSAAPSSPWSRALEIRMAQGWKLKGDRLPVLYTDTINGEGVGRDDLWLCTTKALAASPTPPALSAAPARPTVEQVEDEVSMGHGAWDMVDPQELIGTVLRLSVATSPTHPAEKPQPHYSRLHDADAVHGKQLSVYSKPTAEQQAQPGAVYAELPEPTTHQIAELKACEHGDAIVGWRVEPSRQSFHASMHPKRTLYTTEQARNFADRTHALRQARTTLPEGWTACTIEFGNDGPEEVAYGPQRMMNRLAKWLGKYFAQVIADAAPKAAPGDGWLQSGALLYRLTDDRKPRNRDEIRVTMADGSHTPEACTRRAGELLDRIRAPKQEAQEPAGEVVSASCDYATVRWLRQTSAVGGGDPRNSRSWPITGDKVYLAPQPAPAPLSEMVKAYCAAWEASYLSANTLDEVVMRDDDLVHIAAGIEAALAAQQQ